MISSRDCRQRLFVLCTLDVIFSFFNDDFRKLSNLRDTSPPNVFYLFIYGLLYKDVVTFI